MAACPSCGRENPEGFQFCGFCAAPLAPVAPAREVRKTVTVLFCDVTGSTALGERLDPEALRRTMRRYFEEIRRVVERHGGTVEKFVGDAAMAVFGVPVAHEDDALRAVRAAAELRDRLAALGDELTIALLFRTGVNTGQVVAGEGETLATGDAVNVAARLEQAAEPGGILIGAETLRLVRDAVDVELVQPLELKGKSEPVAAFRLVSVDPASAGRTRRLDAPLVGRVREQERLRADFEDVLAGRACHLFTLLGPAGVGKSRLVAEFLAEAGDQADVLRSRCLHYGEDITYWPLVEMLVAIGVGPDAVIGGSPAETQLAFRRLLEQRAAERPQIVLVDDLQWAEPTFLDLVEHIADWSRDSPILVLCVARPELLEERPGWGGGKLNATTILLEPLSSSDSDLLVDRLAGDAGLTDEVRRRIVRTAAGNPLFLEELLAMAAEGNGGDLAVPPTIQALLQARLERLQAGERDAIERGAVEGEVFHSGAVQALAAEHARHEVPAHLLSLVRKELIRPDRPVFADDDAFRFRHLLIRDAAYEALPKDTRAELHERFATWLERHAELVEQEEIVGYHLEQAHRNRSQLDAAAPGLTELGRRAAAHLLQAARGAFGRGDVDAAAGLITRSTAMLPEGDPQRLAALAELVLAFFSHGVAGDLAPTVSAELAASKDPRLRAYGDLVDGWIRYWATVGAPLDDALVSRARSAFVEARDELGLAYCEWLTFFYHWGACHAESALAAARRSIEHARRAGADHLAAQVLAAATLAPVLGPTPVDEAFELTRQVHVRSEGVLALAQTGRLEGRLLAMRGEFERARELMRAGQATFRDAGLLIEAAAHSQGLMFLESRAGDLTAAEREGRAGVEESRRLGDRAYHGTTAFILADVLVRAGNYEEAEALCAEARDTSSPDDVATICGVDALEGFLRARRGDVDEGERLARRGVELAETTDFVDVRGLAYMLAARALAAVDKRDEGVGFARQAVAGYEAKGDVAGARVAQALADDLASGVPDRPGVA